MFLIRNCFSWVMFQPEDAAHLAPVSDRRIHVIGAVPHEQLPRYYQMADAFVFPSINDGFGVTILEAMGFWIARNRLADDSGAPDVIEDGFDGYIVPIRDANSIRCRLQYSVRTAAAGLKIGRNARARVEREFTWDHYQKNVLGTYQAIVATGLVGAGSHPQFSHVGGLGDAGTLSTQDLQMMARSVSGAAGPELVVHPCNEARVRGVIRLVK